MSFTGNLNASPDKLYFDIQIQNLNNINQEPTILSFIETRNTPLLLNPEEYYMSVVRFNLDTPSLPVFTPSITYNSADRNLTIYSVTLEWRNPVAPNQTFVQQTFITFAPQDLASVLPVPPSQTFNKLQDNSTGYYYIYNYQYWVFLINNAFTTCFNALNAQVVAAGLVLPTTHAPVLTFDTQLNIAILNADILGYNDTVANHINIYFNRPLYQLFSSFPVYIESISATFGRNLQIQTNSFGGSNVVGFPFVAPTYNAIQVFQEFSTISLWTPVKSIVFCSSTLPIVATQVSQPIEIVNGNFIGSNGNNSNQAPIITDFLADGGIYKPQIIYEPTAQYRLVSLQGNRPIYTIDISVYWKDAFSNLIPFRLTAGSGSSIKILFSKKASRNYKDEA
jgi:hypothetical protein